MIFKHVTVLGSPSVDIIFYQQHNKRRFPMSSGCKKIACHLKVREARAVRNGALRLRGVGEPCSTFWRIATTYINTAHPSINRSETTFLSQNDPFDISVSTGKRMCTLTFLALWRNPQTTTTVTPLPLERAYHGQLATLQK